MTQSKNPFIDQLHQLALEKHLHEKMTSTLMLKNEDGSYKINSQKDFENITNYLQCLYSVKS